MRQLLVILFLSVSVISFAQIDVVSKLKSDFELAIINKNETKKVEIATKLFKSYSSTVYAYYNSVLATLPKESILVTNGIDDLFPLLILQTTKNVNPTVDILSLKLMIKHSVYASSVFEAYNLSSSFNKTSKSIYLSRLLNQNKSKLFLSVTIPYTTYSNHQSSLFLIGSVLEHKSTTQYEKLVQFYKSNSLFLNNIPKLSEGEKQLISNCLPALLTLYKMQNQIGKANNGLRKQILSLAKEIGKKDVVEKIVNTYKK